MNLTESLKEAEKEFELGGSYFKFEEGDNKIRILTMWEPLATHFVDAGRKTIAHVCFGKDKGCPYHDEDAPLDEKGNPKSPSVKFMTYICDRKDGDKIKVADLPYTAIKKVAALQANEDWQFDIFLMPYDLTVTYDSNEAGSAMYSVMPSPNREPVPDYVIDGMINKKDVQRIVDERKAKEALGGK